MAKGMYSFIGYPNEQPPEYENDPTEFVGIEKVCEDILKLGGEYAIYSIIVILKEDGSPKKYHYHILAGFETKFPNLEGLSPMVGAFMVVCVLLVVVILVNRIRNMIMIKRLYVIPLGMYDYLNA